MRKSNDQYIVTTLEEMNGKVQTILEIITTTMATKQELSALKEEVREVKSDVKVIKATLTDTSGQLKDHERRITRLEHKVA